MSSRPQFFVYNHQEVIGLSPKLLSRLQASGRRAISEVVKITDNNRAALAKLDEVEVSLLDDDAIADIHLRFMDIAGATDVITFDHGEIHVSVETARVQAAEFGSDFEKELMLYIVHGLLHLAGYDDGTDEESARMDDLQQTILTIVW